MPERSHKLPGNYCLTIPEAHFISYFKQMLAGMTDNLIIADASSTVTKQKDTYNEHHSYSGNVCKIGMDLEDPKARRLTVCSTGTDDDDTREVNSVTCFVLDSWYISSY